MENNDYLAQWEAEEKRIREYWERMYWLNCPDDNDPPMIATGKLIAQLQTL
jgi:phytoene dehydrogenase-like protein